MLEPIVQHSRGARAFGVAGADATVQEYLLAGNDSGALHLTNIFLPTGTVIGAVADNASIGRGLLIYTFPAGQVIVKRVYGDIGLDVNDVVYEDDNPEVGLGTVVSSGAISELNGSTMEDIWGPFIVDDCETNDVATDALQLITVPDLVIAGAGAHTVYLNIADAWGNGTGTPNCTIGTPGARFIIEWYLLPIEGV